MNREVFKGLHALAPAASDAFVACDLGSGELEFCRKLKFVRFEKREEGVKPDLSAQIWQFARRIFPINLSRN